MSGTGAIPPSARPDVRRRVPIHLQCGPRRLNDDPIVYPGPAGQVAPSPVLRQHARRTRTRPISRCGRAGNSTCMSPLNRSAYWMPAMLDGRGNVVRPDYVAIYYKRRPKTDPKCSLTSGDPQAEGNCVPLPNGLEVHLRLQHGDPSQTPTGSLWFNCQGPGSIPGHYADIVDGRQILPGRCPARCGDRGARLLGRQESRQRRSPEPRRLRELWDLGL